MKPKTTVWFHVPPLKVAIAAAPKCGTTGLARIIYEYLYEDGYAKGEDKPNWKLRKDGLCTMARQVPADYHRIMVWRHPRERFESLWRQQHRQLTPNGLLQRIARGPDADMHFQPQNCYREGQVVEIWPLKHRDERLRDMGFKWFPERGPQTNATEGSVPPYDLGLLRKIYRTDFEIWERLFEQKGTD